MLRYAQKLVPLLLMIIPISWITVGYWLLDSANVEINYMHIGVWLVSGVIPWLVVWYISKIINDSEPILSSPPSESGILKHFLAVVALVVIPFAMFFIAVFLFIWKRSLIY